MSYTTLMVQLELGRSNEAPLTVTRALAGRFHSAIIGIAVAQPYLLVAGDGFYSADIIEQDSVALEQDSKAAEVKFRATFRACGAALDWRTSLSAAPLSDIVSGSARDADLLVIGVDQEGRPYFDSTRRVNADDLIMQVGRPVFVVPTGVSEFDFRCAVIGWKESREARRAVADAIPLLKEMGKTVLVQVADAEDHDIARAHLDKIAAWLGRHGVAATCLVTSATGDDAARLCAVADEEGADLIVAGAYGHSRLREWVLGGVTRALLHGGGRCLLLSH
jgi:nucleotide-binding universal stress UspA family protein